MPFRDRGRWGELEHNLKLSAVVLTLITTQRDDVKNTCQYDAIQGQEKVRRARAQSQVECSCTDIDHLTEGWCKNTSQYDAIQGREKVRPARAQSQVECSCTDIDHHTEGWCKNTSQYDAIQGQEEVRRARAQSLVECSCTDIDHHTERWCKNTCQYDAIQGQEEVRPAINFHEVCPPHQIFLLLLTLLHKNGKSSLAIIGEILVWCISHVIWGTMKESVAHLIITMLF